MIKVDTWHQTLLRASQRKISREGKPPGKLSWDSWISFSMLLAILIRHSIRSIDLGWTQFWVFWVKVSKKSKKRSLYHSFSDIPCWTRAWVTSMIQSSFRVRTILAPKSRTKLSMIASSGASRDMIQMSWTKSRREEAAKDSFWTMRISIRKIQSTRVAWASVTTSTWVKSFKSWSSSL